MPLPYPASLPTKAFTVLPHSLTARRQLRLCLTVLFLTAFLFFAVNSSGYINSGTGLVISWTLWKGSVSKNVNETESPTPAIEQPLTVLGFEADNTYENIGSMDIDIYRQDLESFLSRAFPKTDSDQQDPNSLLSILREFMPLPPTGPPVLDAQKGFQQLLLYPFANVCRKIISHLKPQPPPPARVRRVIPANIHQTSWHPGTEPPAEKQSSWVTWKTHNPLHQYRYYDDDAARTFIHGRFDHSLSGDRTGSIAETYETMSGIPVMQSDFWRYAMLATDGGVYCECRMVVTLNEILMMPRDPADLDTLCLKPISGWHRPPWQRIPSNYEDPDLYPIPSLIVGIEQDVGTRSDWHDWWPRPLGLAQWTIASTRGHPIMLDVLRRVQETVNPVNSTTASAAKNIQEGAHRNLDAVVEMTGPGPFTDSVLRCESVLIGVFIASLNKFSTRPWSDV